MTVESTLTKQIYEGNGLAAEWPVPFAYSRPQELRLMLTDPAGVETPVTGNFQVKVAGGGDTSILYPVAGPPLPAGHRLTVYLQTPRTQIVDLQYGGAFNPDVLEKDGFDRLEMQIQEIQEQTDRAVKVPLSSDKTPENLMEELFTARDEARESAADAEDAADRAEVAANGAYISSGAYNARVSFISQVNIPGGGALALPASYFPTRNVLFMTYNDVPCTPKTSDIYNGGDYQYDEVGDDPNAPSSQVIVHFPIKVGDKIDVWVVTSAIGRNVELIEQAVADSAAAATAATASKASADTSALSAAGSEAYALAYMECARKWAINPEDEPVVCGGI